MDEGWGEVAIIDSSEWYEVSVNEFGVPVRSASRRLRIDGKDLVIYEVTNRYDFRTMGIENYVIVSNDRSVLEKVLDKVKSIGEVDNITPEKGKYLITIRSGLDVRKLINSITTITDYPQMSYKVDGDTILIRFSDTPPPKFRKRMRDFRIGFNSSKGVWVGKLDKEDMEKILLYFKKQYNNI